MQTIWQNPQNQSSGGSTTTNDPQKNVASGNNNGAIQNKIGGQRIQSQHQTDIASQTTTNAKPAIAPISSNPLPTTSKPLNTNNNQPIMQNNVSPKKVTTSFKQPTSSSQISNSTPNTSLQNKSMPLSKMTPEQRQEILTKIFKMVLNREPTTKDLSYYKYSILTEDKLQISLLKGSDHKNLISQGQEYTKIKKAYTDLKLQNKFTQDKLSTLVEEYNVFKKLLHEKNRVIQVLRQNINKLQGYNAIPITEQPAPMKNIVPPINQSVLPPTANSNEELGFDQHYNEKQVVNSNSANTHQKAKSPFKLLISQLKELLSPPY